MTDRITPIRDFKADIDGLVDDLDLEQLGRRVQEFGRENPIALAAAALTLGVAAGFLMRKGFAQFGQLGSQPDQG
jgi:hypothetical protein